jgi:hypothetical protein
MQRQHDAEPRDFTTEDLAHEEATELPDREAMSLLDPGLLAGAGIGGLPTSSTPAPAMQAPAIPNLPLPLHII